MLLLEEDLYFGDYPTLHSHGQFILHKLQM